MTDSPATRRDDPPLRYRGLPRGKGAAYSSAVAGGLLAVGIAFVGGGVPLLESGNILICLVGLVAVLPLSGLYAWLALGSLAMTRPWWRLEVRGSVYIEHKQYGLVRNYDLATVTGVAVTASRHEGPWVVRLRLLFGERRGVIRFADNRRLALALADALDEHPHPEVVRAAAAELRWFVTASHRDRNRRYRLNRRNRRRSGYA